MMDRAFAWFFYGTAYFFGIAATLILLAGFMDYLQSGHWSDMSLLELGYDSYLVGPEKADFVGFMEIWATSFG